MTQQHLSNISLPAHALCTCVPCTAHNPVAYGVDGVYQHFWFQLDRQDRPHCSLHCSFVQSQFIIISYLFNRCGKSVQFTSGQTAPTRLYAIQLIKISDIPPLNQPTVLMSKARALATDGYIAYDIQPEDGRTADPRCVPALTSAYANCTPPASIRFKDCRC